MANIVFEIPQRLYILTDLTKEALDKISYKMWEINKDTGSNECNYYDFQDIITFENIKPETIRNIKQTHSGLEYENLEIDSEVHKISKKIKMCKVPLDTFKSRYLETIFTSKRYEIESDKDSVLKLKGLEEEIDLKKVKYKYSIQE